MYVGTVTAPTGQDMDPPTNPLPELLQPVTLQGHGCDQGPHPVCFSLVNSSGMSGFGPRHQECHLQLWSHAGWLEGHKALEPLGCGVLGWGALAQKEAVFSPF